MRHKYFATAVLVLGCTAALAMAQDQKRSEQRRPPGGGFGGGASAAGLLAMPEVLKELAITDEQKGLIQDMLTDLREQQGGGNRGDFQNLSQEERQKRFEEARKRREGQDKKSDEMTKMILEPKQYERLEQLRVQRGGAWGLARPEVADRVGLSEEQREKIRSITQAAFGDRGSFANFRNMSESERAEARTKMRERGEKLAADIQALLTPEQRTTWEKMQGKKFDFPQREFGGRPGGNAGRRQNRT
jgi:hypothetical protein